jgi:O-antigen/teichoic acid export membrane protein
MGYKANITSNLINQVIRIAVGALTGIIVARVLGPAGLGYVTYAVLIFTLIGDFGHFGLNNAVMYFKKRSSYNPDHIFNVNVSFLGLLFMAISAVVLIIRSAGLALTGYNYLYILGGLVFVASDLLFTNFHSWYIGDERIVESNRSIRTVFLIKSAAILILWASGMLTPGSFFVVTALAMLLNAILLKINLKQGFSPRIDLKLLKAEYGFGGIVWLGAIFAFLHYRVDQLMIKQMLGISDLGVYSVSVSLAELMFLVPVSINTALLGKLYNTGEKIATRRVMSQTLKLSLYVCSGLALIGIPLSLLIPFVYGEAYSGAVICTMILLVGVIFASLAKVSAPYFFTIGKPVFHLVITFITLLLNAALNYLLIPVHGIVGAAIASSISYLAYGVFYLLLLMLREEFTPRDLFHLRFEDIRLLWKKS